jgi:hypothetical protein
VLHAHATHIASECLSCRTDEIVVASVLPDFRFGGARRIPRGLLREEIATTPEGGWTMTFQRGTTLEAVEDRCIRLGARGYRRWKLSAQYRRRHEKT